LPKKASIVPATRYEILLPLRYNDGVEVEVERLLNRPASTRFPAALAPAGWYYTRRMLGPANPESPQKLAKATKIEF
jgi:hypothetical protein